MSTAGSNILDDFTPPYELTVTQTPVERRRGDARQAQHGRVRHGLVERDQRLRPGGLALAARGLQRQRGGSGAIEGTHLVPGGSSGGSASAVAARLCLGATATDTGGSIRQPAAFTGTVGIKPTYGRCSRWGMVAFASSLDQAGPIARTVRDSRHHAALDGGPRSQGHHVGRSAGAGFRGGRLARREGPHGSAFRKNTASTACRPRSRNCGRRAPSGCGPPGAEIVEVSLPHTKYALPAYYIVAPAEASSNLARYDGVRYGLRVPGKDITDMYENTRAAGLRPRGQAPRS